MEVTKKWLKYMKNSNYIIEADRLLFFIQDILEHSGLSKNDAIIVAKGIWLANMRGIDSHGVRLLPHYVKAIKAGRINNKTGFSFEKKSNSVGILDANHGFGHLASFKAMEEAINIANETGVAAVSVKNSNHNGIMAYYAIEAAKQNMIGIAMTHTTSRMATPNAAKTFFGTNPICFAAPMLNEEPLCYDGATTIITGNKLRQNKELGIQLPENVAVTKDGNQTTNPEIATFLTGIGGYKGFGLAMFIDVFSGLLSGMAVADSISSMTDDAISKKRKLGHFFIAINISSFQNIDDFKINLQNLADKIRKEKSLNNTPVMVPGDIEKKYEKQKRKGGIALPSFLIKELNEIAEELCLTKLI